MAINETVVYLMVVAIGIGALALAAQAVAAVMLAKQAKAVKEHLDRMAPKAEAVLASADTTLASAGETIKTSREQITSLTTKTNEILDSAKVQMQRTDEFLTDATARARIQLDRVELVLDDSIGRVHETVVTLNDGVLRPVQQVTGIIAGMRAAFDYFLGGKKPDVSQATTDEEMFI